MKQSNLSTNSNIKFEKANINFTFKIFLTFALMLSLVFSFINVTGAWFTDSSGTNKTVNAYIKTSEANLNVYQENSAGTQTRIEKSLPTGYTQLEYIEANGKQIINTGIKPTSSMRFVGKTYVQRPTTTSDNYIFASGSSYSNFVGLMITRGKAVYVGLGNQTASGLDFSGLDTIDYYNFDFDFSYTQTSATVKVSLDDNLKTYSKNYTSITLNSGNIYLFDRVSMNASWLTRIFEFKIWDNDILVRNYIPAKNSSGTLGLYDLVEGKFYTNAGTGTFVAGSESLTNTTVSLAYDSSNKTNNKITVNDLPVGYTQLEYLESTGTQYIDTAVKPSTTLEFDLTMQLNTATGDQKFFGSYDSGVFLGALGGKWRYGNTCSINDVTATTDITRIELKNGVWYFNSTPGATQSPKANDWTISLFAVNYSGNPKFQLNAIKVYSLKIWQDYVQVRNFIPAKNSSGVCSMYDTVEGKFYTNAGTGTFVGGEEVCDNNLKLLLKNEDFGASFGVRYKVNFYAITSTGKQLLTSSIAGMTAPTGSSNGFVYNNADGYYYYQNSAGENVEFEPATGSQPTSKYLMQSFSIDYTSVANLFGGNSVYMEVIVESVNIS